MGKLKLRKPPAPVETPAPVSVAPEPEPASNRYRIRPGSPVHWIGGELVKAPAVVSLPPGHKPSRWMDPA